MNSYPEFIRIPHQIIKNDGLRTVDGVVYGVVYWFSKMKNDVCIASNEVIAEVANVSPTTVAHALQRLEANGCILRTYSDVSKRHRKEIFPMVVNNKLPVSPNVPSDSPNVPSDSPNIQSKEVVLIVQTDNHVGPNVPSVGPNVPSVGPNVQEKKKGKEDKKNKKNFFAPSAPNGKNGQKEEEPKEKKEKEDSTGQKINDTIALFLPILPGDFVGQRSAFAKQPTRDAVQSLLLTHSMEQIRELIRMYDEGKADQFRPHVGTVYEFCTTKLAKIESFVIKKHGSLWANKPISTPAHSAMMDDIIKKKLDDQKAESARKKAIWESEHPNGK